jgi:hypothetical protein
MKRSGAVNLIACTNNCIYQQNGCCSLDRAASGGVTDKNAGCIHYVPKHSDINSESKKIPNYR